MLVSISLLVSLLLNVVSTLPFNNTKKDLEHIQSIVSEYVSISAHPNPSKEETKIFKWAETVHECRKILGITSHLRRYKHSSKVESAYEYQYENNTESENNIPTWPLSPSALDGIFDSARFDRCLTSIHDPSFDRRITWLYPSDGKDEYLMIIFIFFLKLIS